MTKLTLCESSTSAVAAGGQEHICTGVTLMRADVCRVPRDEPATAAAATAVALQQTCGSSRAMACYWFLQTTIICVRYISQLSHFN